MIYEKPAVQSWGNVGKFFRLFLPKHFMPRTNPADDWRVQKLRNSIDNDPARVHWNPDQVCEELGLRMSGRQAHRLFKACTGVGFKQYAKKKCLDSAAQQLLTTDTPVKTIAVDAGYRHLSTFTRYFLKQFGLNPTEFRRISRLKNVAAQSEAGERRSWTIA
jgi:AraC-like DNA-binding protein